MAHNHAASLRRSRSCAGHCRNLHRAAAVVVVVGLVAVPPVSAGDNPVEPGAEPDREVTGRVPNTDFKGSPDPAALRDRGAFVIQPLDPKLVSKLQRGFAIALDRLERHAPCRLLFEELDDDGVAKLFKTIYLSARREDLRRLCRDRNAAYTYLSLPHTRLCPAFGRLSDTRAAIIVLHEALHYAGLEESPTFPDAMTSAEINRMVESHCGF
jgi:hypothetical protein